LIRLAVIASMPALRSGLRAMLAGDERIEIVAEAAAASELLDGSDAGGLDVLLLAGDEPALSDLSAALTDSEDLPPAVLLLSEQPEAARLLPRLHARAWGLLPPDCTEEELAAAIFAIHEGLLASAPALIQHLFGPAPAEAGEELAEELTERELDVLQLLAQGLANKQIALQLNISEHTVKFHSSAIYAKLGVTNRTEAVRRGARLGLVVL
jgi:DNA-binding NarL/FixJ family response regulator